MIIRQVVQLIYSANPRTVQDAIGGSFDVAGMVVPWWRLVLVIATAVLVANLITDIGYALVDPRVRLGERV